MHLKTILLACVIAPLVSFAQVGLVSFNPADGTADAVLYTTSGIPLNLSGGGGGITNEVDPVFTNWLGTSTVVSVEADPLFTNMVTEGKLETQIGGSNLIIQQEIDTIAELDAIVTDFDFELRAPYTLTPDANQSNAITTVQGGNVATGLYSAVLSGAGNVATADYSVVLGGSNNAAKTPFSVIVGGQRNKAEQGIRKNIFIGGGEDHIANRNNAAIVGGDGNVAQALNGGTFAGEGNDIFDGQDAVIVGGLNHTINGDQAAGIFAGLGGVMDSLQSAIVGGNNVTMDEGQDNGTLGGKNITVFEAQRSAVVGGDGGNIVGLNNSDEVDNAFIGGGDGARIANRVATVSGNANRANATVGGIVPQVLDHSRRTVIAGGNDLLSINTRESFSAAGEELIIETSIWAFAVGGKAGYNRGTGVVSIGSGIINTQEGSIIFNSYEELAAAITNISTTTTNLVFPGGAFVTNSLIDAVIVWRGSAIADKAIATITAHDATNIVPAYHSTSGFPSNPNGEVFDILDGARPRNDGYNITLDENTRIGGTVEVSVISFVSGAFLESNDGTNLFFHNVNGFVTNISLIP